MAVDLGIDGTQKESESEKLLIAFNNWECD